MPLLTDDERQLRADAAQASVTSQRLEGVEPSQELISDLDRWTDGFLTLDQVGERLFARFAKKDRRAGRR